MKTLAVFLCALSIISFAASMSFADDLWSETPDLTNLSSPPFAQEPTRVSNEPPAVDMWAETPDLSARQQDVEFHQEKLVATTGSANPEMYKETPDLNGNAPERSPAPAAKVLIAGQ